MGLAGAQCGLCFVLRVGAAGPCTAARRRGECMLMGVWVVSGVRECVTVFHLMGLAGARCGLYFVLRVGAADSIEESAAAGAAQAFVVVRVWGIWLRGVICVYVLVVRAVFADGCAIRRNML